jgi:hypothetical protein
MGCVCGHSRVDHRTVAMSVPLIGRKPEPLYPLPAAAGGIAMTYATSTLEQQACWCGCTLFEEL